FNQRSGFVDFLRLPITEIKAQQIVKHCPSAAAKNFIPQRSKVSLVAPILVAHLKDRIAPGCTASGNDPIAVRRHHHVKKVGSLKRRNILRLNRYPLFGHQALEPSFRFLIASPKRFVQEQEHTVLQVTAERTKQVPWLRHWQRIRTQYLH